MRSLKTSLAFFLLIIPFLVTSCEVDKGNIERPEKIVSKRQVVYDLETYSKLAELWKKYYDQFPSEDSYANWMYAARYAKDPDYETLLEEGVKKYSANPTLLYLKALIKHGKENDREAIQLLEKSIALDPSFIDPWFGLVTDYVGSGEIEKSDNALRQLLSNGAISDEVMDYNYNVITLLEKNAILFTNGDNDTYPPWILTRILEYRPDVKIVNRSLLNTTWYPNHLIKNDGIPNFITRNGLDELRNKVFENIKSGSMKMPAAGPVSDTLISLLVNAALKQNRPVYLASTLFRTNTIKNLLESGINLGLVTKVKAGNENENDLIKRLTEKWISEFRTAGLSSWQLRYSNKGSSGKRLTINYGGALKSLMDQIIKYAPDKRLELFNWYQNLILNLIPDDKADDINSSWCKSADIPEIKKWCETNNYIE